MLYGPVRSVRLHNCFPVNILIVCGLKRVSSSVKCVGDDRPLRYAAAAPCNPADIKLSIFYRLGVQKRVQSAPKIGAGGEPALKGEVKRLPGSGGRRSF